MTDLSQLTAEWNAARILYPTYSALAREFVIGLTSCNDLETGVVDGAAERGQRVHHAGLVVDEAVVVVLPPGLVLLRAVVVVDREQHGPEPGAADDRVAPAVVHQRCPVMTERSRASCASVSTRGSATRTRK